MWLLSYCAGFNLDTPFILGLLHKLLVIIGRGFYYFHSSFYNHVPHHLHHLVSASTVVCVKLMVYYCILTNNSINFSTVFEVVNLHAHHYCKLTEDEQVQKSRGSKTSMHHM